MTTWTKEDAKHDVSNNGNGYVKIEEHLIPALQQGNWYMATRKPCAYSEKHSVVGIFSQGELANAAGQVLLLYGLPTLNVRDLSRRTELGQTFYELTLPPVFGANALLSHNRVTLHATRNEAIHSLQQRSKCEI